MTKRKDDENLRNSFTAWVEHVVRNAKHYYLRKEVKRIRTVSLDEIDSEILYYEINNEKIEDFFFGDEKIYNAYKELSCMRKKVLRLLFIHEMTIMEISKELNIPSSYVSNLKYYALKKLKENIEKELKK